MKPEDNDTARSDLGRIAYSLGDITIALEKAVAIGDLGAIANGVAELGQLRMSLTQSANHPLQAQQQQRNEQSEEPEEPTQQQERVGHWLSSECPYCGTDILICAECERWCRSEEKCESCLCCIKCSGPICGECNCCAECCECEEEEVENDQVG